jgi:hypothetical protein
MIFAIHLRRAEHWLGLRFDISPPNTSAAALAGAAGQADDTSKIARLDQHRSRHVSD